MRARTRFRNRRTRSRRPVLLEPDSAGSSRNGRRGGRVMIAIARFELARHLRAFSTYVYFVILAAIACLVMLAAGGAFQSANVVVGGGGKVLVNSPYTLAAFISLLSYFGLLIVSAVVGRAAFQDFEHGTHSFFFAAPISKAAYLGGRFA